MENFDKTYKKLFNSAKKFNRRGHFQLKDKNNYMQAWNLGILDLVCCHMKDKHKNLKWDISSLKKEAKKYHSRGEFQKKSRSAYITSYVNGLLDDVCEHMSTTKRPKPTKKINLEEITELALKYSRISDFCRENMGKFYALKRHNR